jgi:predicted GNAT family acetyltransferase
MTHDIRNNADQSQYETTIDGHVAFVAYDLEEPRRIVFTHTVVPEVLGGRGLGGALVEHALADARERNLIVVPQCPYVAAYIRKHPEYEALLA